MAKAEEMYHPEHFALAESVKVEVSTPEKQGN
jgi:hypothetical protein